MTLMSLSALDLALRAATVALLLVLAASLFRDFRHVVAGRLAAAFALGSAAHAVTSAIGATAPVSVWHAPLIALSTGNVVVFWLFTRALFDDPFRLRWWHALIWAAVAAFSFVNCMWIAPAGHARVSRSSRSICSRSASLRSRSGRPSPPGRPISSRAAAASASSSSAPPRFMAA